MSRLARLAAFTVVLVALGCSNLGVDNPTAPTTTQLPGLQAVTTGGSCTLKTASDIEAEIVDLYFQNDWPDPNSALSKFNQVKALLAAGSTVEAQLKARDLVRFIENKFSNLSPAEQAETQDEMDTVVEDIYCFVGISGTVFDLNPGDPAKAFATPGGTGGVWFPPNSVPVGTMVVLEDITSLYECPSGAFCGQGVDKGGIAVVNNGGMPVEHQAPRNITAHAAQSNNPELHVLMLLTTNKVCQRL